MFRVRDLREGVVIYHHSDSDTTRDHIVFRISDGRHSIRHKFPINILPKDDSPPFLINNVAVEVLEGGAVRLEDYILLASDLDSSDDYILFQIVSSPRAGQLIRRPSPHKTGEGSACRFDLNGISLSEVGGMSVIDVTLHLMIIFINGLSADEFHDYC